MCQKKFRFSSTSNTCSARDHHVIGHSCQLAVDGACGIQRIDVYMNPQPEKGLSRSIYQCSYYARSQSLEYSEWTAAADRGFPSQYSRYQKWPTLVLFNHKSTPNALIWWTSGAFRLVDPLLTEQSAKFMNQHENRNLLYPYWQFKWSCNQNEMCCYESRS